MTVPIKYRISSVAAKPTADSVKGVPLTSLEIDGNFRSIKEAIEDFSETGGSALVGYDGGGTVQDVLDGAKSMQGPTALRAYTGRATGVRITTPGIAGVFQRLSGFVADNGVTVFVDGLGRSWRRLYDGPVNVKWSGAKGNGIDDDHAFILLAVAIGEDVFFPFGRYLSSAEIPLNPGQRIFGINGGRFSTDATRTILESVNNSTPFFVYESSFSGQVDGFAIDELTIVSDNPIKINDPATTITDGGASPYVMRPELRRNSFIAKNAGTGTGVLISKCFDHVISQNEFVRFGRQLVQQGCDLGNVKTNRFTDSAEFGFLDLSTSTFGSQTRFENNDMVRCGLTGTFIKSTSRHVRVVDNYLEQTGANCKAFIDLSSTDAPVYGANSPSSTRLSSIVCRENRLDGKNFATDFIYRLETGFSTSVEIKDSGTTGPLSVGQDLVIQGDGLPVIYNVLNGVMYDICGARFGEYRAYKTKSSFGDADSLCIDSENITQFRSDLQANNAHLHMRIQGRSIALLPTFLANVTNCRLTFPSENGVANPHFETGATYECTVVAKSTVNADVLRIARISGGSGSTFNDYTLSTQRRSFKFRFSGAATTAATGVYFAVGAGSTGTILIESISFKRIKFGSMTVDPGSRTTGTQTLPIAITVPGAVLGEIANVSFTQDLQGMSLRGYVSASDTVSAIFRNDTGATIDLPSGTLSAWTTSNA